MKLKHIYTILCAGAMAMLPSCASDGPAHEPQPEGGTLTRLKVTMADTRAGLDDTQFSEGDEALVILNSYQEITTGAGIRTKASMKATYNGDFWELEKEYKIPEAGVNVDFYYPYEVFAQSELKEIVCSPDPHELTYAPINFKAVNTDIIASLPCNLINPKNPVANINCRHRMARLHFDLKGDLGANPECKLIFTSGAWDNASFGNWEGGLSFEGTSFNTPSSPKIENIELVQDEEGKYMFDYLIIPNTELYFIFDLDKENLRYTITLSVNGKEVQITPYELDKSGDEEEWGGLEISSDGFFNGGGQYNFTVNFGGDDPVVEDEHPGLYLGTKADNGKPLVWAKYNVGADDNNIYGQLVSRTEIQENPNIIWKGWRIPTNKEESQFRYRWGEYADSNGIVHPGFMYVGTNPYSQYVLIPTQQNPETGIYVAQFWIAVSSSDYIPLVMNYYNNHLDLNFGSGDKSYLRLVKEIEESEIEKYLE